MTAVRHALLALLVATVALGGIVGHVGADAENLTISAVTIEPDQPAPGEPFTVTTTITNSEGGSGSVEVRSVYIREATGLPEYERIENLGSIGDDQSIEVPMQLSLEESKNLRVHVSARASDGENIHLEYPVYVTVREIDDVQLSFSTTDAVAGVDTPVTLTVANGDSNPIANLQLTLEGESATVGNPQRASASVPASSDREYEYTVRFAEPGDEQLTATLSYSTAEGYRRTIQETETVGVEQAVIDTDVTARVVTDGETADPPVTVDISNFGNVLLSEVSVRVTDGDRTVARQLVGDVPAQSSRSIAVNVSGVDDTTLRVTASYEVGSTVAETSTTVRYRANPGRIELTGVGTDRVDDGVVITGSASNVGQSEVTSVIVRVVPADGVEPVSPNREYFVGTVPASDFVSFDLSARVEANVTRIPIEITYLSGGVERSERVEVAVDLQPDADQDPSPSSRLGLVVPVVIGAIVVIAVGGLVYLGWRNRDGH